MAKKCDVCGKGVRYGNKVSHANNRTRRRWLPNIQRVRVLVQGIPKHLTVCTRCIRTGAVAKA